MVNKVLATKQCPHCFKQCRVERNRDVYDLVKLPYEDVSCEERLCKEVIELYKDVPKEVKKK